MDSRELSVPAVPRRVEVFRPSAAVALVAGLTTLVAFTALAGAAEDPTAAACAVADIHEIGWSRLEPLQRTAELGWWVELADQLLLCGDGEAVARVATEFEIRPIEPPLRADEVWLARGFDATDLAAMGLEIVAGSGRLSLVRVPDGFDPARRAAEWGLDDHRLLTPVRPGTVVVRQAANEPERDRRSFSAPVQTLVDEIDGARWFADVVQLTTFNRYTRSPQILAARDWIVNAFAALPGVSVETPSFLVGSTVAYNVVATVEGSSRPDDWYIVGGHYDSTSESPYVAAPGAEDNASGCAGVLELARVLTAHPPEGTVLFICFSGEEQGLWGSEDHVADLIASGDASKVRAMIDLDMIGYTSDPDLDCLLESEPFAQFLIDLLVDAAAQYTMLRIETSLFAWGSDHVPYLDVGIPALLTIENDWDEYPYYHTTNDLPQHLTLAMGEEILKMNVAALGELAGAGVAEVFADGFESGGLSAWSFSQPN